jgi:hypothetical protein
MAKTISGYVLGTGQIESGQGFKVDRVQAGLYTIIFNDTFDTMPAVVATQQFDVNHSGMGGSTLDNAVVVTIQKDRTRIKVGDSVGNPTDRNFAFTAIG